MLRYLPCEGKKTLLNSLLAEETSADLQMFYLFTTEGMQLNPHSRRSDSQFLIPHMFTVLAMPAAGAKHLELLKI